MAEALQSELLAVPGVAGAEVDSEQGVAGVRVQLSVDADAEAVGAAVRRILSDHGMRPVSPERDRNGEGPPPPPGAPGSVVAFPLVGEAAGAEAGTGAEPAIEGVAVEETPDGVSVSVRGSNGRRVVRQLEAGIGGMDEAVVVAVSELLGRGDAAFMGAAEEIMDGTSVVTVLVEIGGKPVAGAAVQSGGRAFAVAVAAWEAVRAPDG